MSNESESRFDSNLCPHGNTQLCELCKQERFARGEITGEEIDEYWQNPDKPLFSHTLESSGKKTEIEVRGLTDNYLRLLKNLWGAWDLTSFLGLAYTLDKYRRQKKTQTDPLLSAEYYTATDKETSQPVGMTGLYTLDIYGPGFATIDKLDRSRHNFSTGFGWFSVSKKYQGQGLGRFLFDWTENLARARGASHMFIETDNAVNEQRAVELYERRGYKLGFKTPDYFGPGRDLTIYYADISGEKIDAKQRPKEQVSEKNRAEVLELARKQYPPERFEEFEVGLDLMLRQSGKGILESHSFVIRNQQGQVESFAIMFTGAAYKNVIINSWHGSRPEQQAQDRMMRAVKATAKSNDVTVIMTPREGEDHELKKHGFLIPEKGIPRVFGKNDETEFLLYTKKL